MILQMLRNIAGSIYRKIANVGDYIALLLYRNNIISSSGWFMRFICRSSSVRAIILKELGIALERQENDKIFKQLTRPEVKYIINAYEGTPYISHLLTSIRKKTGNEIKDIMSLLGLKSHSFIINLIDINDSSDLIKQIAISELSKDQCLQVLKKAAEKNYVSILELDSIVIYNDEFKVLYNKALQHKNKEFLESLVKKKFPT